MSTLVTGSAGHLGEALVRTLRGRGASVVAVDRVPSGFTDLVGSITDRGFVERCMDGVEKVLHTATLHKPHIATHTRQQFLEVNVTGTLNLLEASVASGVRSFVFTSSTSTFGDALSPAAGDPAAWITEDVKPITKNIYGATKLAAEDLCWLVHRNDGLPCVVLKTSRFFPEQDDNRSVRERFQDNNAKLNEYLYRRVDIEDVVSAHELALEKAPSIGFGRYIISATSPFMQDDVYELRTDPTAALRRRVPEYESFYSQRSWKMFSSIDRVYVNERARTELGWHPRHCFEDILRRLEDGEAVLSPLALTVGAKGYHETSFADGPYPVEPADGGASA